MLLVNEDIRDGSLTGFFVKVFLNVRTILALVKFIDLHRLAFGQVQVVDEALCTTAVWAVRLGEHGDKVFVD